MGNQYALGSINAQTYISQTNSSSTSLTKNETYTTPYSRSISNGHYDELVELTAQTRSNAYAQAWVTSQ